MKFALFAMIFSFASCTEGMCSSTESSHENAVEHVVEITSFAFVPNKLNAKAGDTITWVNRDIVPHTATGERSDWNTGTLLQNESRTISVSATMSTEYFCRFHINMTAAISVSENGNHANSSEISNESNARSSGGN